MAEQSSSSQEKTEDATPRRMRDARKKGQVSKSRDVNTVVILIAAFGLLGLFIGYITQNIRLVMNSAFEFASKTSINNEDIFLRSKEYFIIYVKTVLPFLGVIMIVALAVGFFQVGPIFASDPLKPKMDRLNIITNIKNMFKMTTFVELLKNIAKVTLIFILAYTVLKDNMREIVSTVMASPLQSTAVASQIITSFLVKVFICFVIIAAADLMVQRWQHKKQMRMTKEEVKREYKEDEGDPLIKSMRKHLYQEMVMSDMKQSVRTSDVVITNPTELAVAIKYDDKEMASPQIMAKGQRLFAEMIIETAKEAGVPIIQNIPLAWALIDLELGDEIPEELYAAVAEVLIAVYRLKNNA